MSVPGGLNGVQPFIINMLCYVITFAITYYNIVYVTSISFNPLLCSRFGPSGLICWLCRAQGAVAAVGSEWRGAA